MCVCYYVLVGGVKTLSDKSVVKGKKDERKRTMLRAAVLLVGTHTYTHIGSNPSHLFFKPTMRVILEIIKQKFFLSALGYNSPPHP